MERACVLLPPGGGKREKDRTIPTYVAVKINGGNNPPCRRHRSITATPPIDGNMELE